MRYNGALVPMRHAVCLLAFLCLQSHFHLVSSWKNWMADSADDAKAPDMDMKELKSSYGVDCSFPTHHTNGCESNPFGSSTQKAYDAYMQGCKKYYAISPERCDEWENQRMERNRNQPVSSHNFTALGFAKMRAPRSLWRRLLALLDEHGGEEVGERGREANTWMNQWDFFSYMIDIRRAVGMDLQKDIIQVILPIVERWTKTSLSPAAVYGIRLFISGTTVPPHVDLPPLAVTAVLNIAQEPEDQAWPMELIGHDGRAYNISSRPGEMILYTGSSVIHGHPFPMQGTYSAFVYVYFEPNAVPYIHNKENEVGDAVKKSMKEAYKYAMERKQVESSRKRDMPDFLDGTGEGRMWTQQYVYADIRHETPVEHNMKLRQTVAHRAAAKGNLEALKEIGSKDASLLHQEDANGWRPLHEAARAGSVEVIQYLVDNGANVNERTNRGKGGTPLWWASFFHGEKHESVELLKKLGGVAIKPQIDLL